MKANEAPEKIILSADRETGTLHDEWVIEDLTDNIKIEYVRKDAFIEKACKFIKERFVFADDKEWHTEDELTVKDEVIEDFREYMEE